MDGGAGMKVVHYLNQFFAGLGAEEAAGHEPVRLEGPQGPGRAFAAAGLDVDVTIACGDDRFALEEAASLAALLAWIDDEAPDVVIAGPSFGSGRYGYACGVLAREVARRRIPVVLAMTPDSPGVLAAEGGAYIVPTGSNVAGMRQVVPVMAGLALRVGAGETVGGPDDEGYLPRGLRVNVRADDDVATRAVRALVAKLGGQITTEIDPPADRVSPPPPVPDLSRATIALVTEAGCVPQGNPDRLPTRHANVWLRYPLDGRAAMTSEDFVSVHAGFDTTDANADPNRLVPLDAARALVDAGRIGSLHEEFFTTSGVDTPVAVAARFGQEIAAEIANAGVDAVILTGT
jgi:glycine reductase